MGLGGVVCILYRQTHTAVLLNMKAFCSLPTGEGLLVGLQTLLLIFHLNEPSILTAGVIGLTALVCVFVCMCLCVFLSHFRTVSALFLSIHGALEEYFHTYAVIFFSDKIKICLC